MLHEVTTGLKHKGQLHQNLMSIAWLLFANLGLWSQYFTWSPIFVNLHSACMAIVVLMTWVSGFMAIVEFGVEGMGPLHVGLGIGVLVVVLGVAATGVGCKSARVTPKMKPEYVVIFNKVHIFGGWLLLTTTCLQFLTTLKKSKLALATILYILSFSLFLLLKYFLKKRSQQTSMPSPQQQQKQQKIREIGSLDELGKFREEFFVFEDRVYGVDFVLGNHPGGWELVKGVRGREVDRYLYGSQPLEISVDSSWTYHEHFAQSIGIAGPPIAILTSPSPYPNLTPQNPSTLYHLTKQSLHPKIFIPYLSPKQSPTSFLFTGYTQLCQLGKYFAVSIQNKKTRLYSCVNFLCFGNLELIREIVGRELWERNRVVVVDGEVREIVGRDWVEVGDYVPLMVKKYGDGKFTKQFLSGSFTDQVKISRPRGQGLALQEVQPGRILILAAGTGLNPFCDLIDLIYKQSLICQSHQLSQKILKQNPILNSKPFKQYQLIIYISVQELTEIHPVTLYQANYLAEKKRIRVFVMTKDKDLKGFLGYPGLGRIQDRFQNVLEQWVGANGKDVQRVYICGPPKFNQTLSLQLQSLNLPATKYKIL